MNSVRHREQNMNKRTVKYEITIYLSFENRLKRPCLTLEMPKRSEHPHNLEHCNEGNSCLSLHRVEKQKEKERGRTGEGEKSWENTPTGRELVSQNNVSASWSPSA